MMCALAAGYESETSPVHENFKGACPCHGTVPEEDTEGDRQKAAGTRSGHHIMSGERAENTDTRAS